MTKLLFLLLLIIKLISVCNAVGSNIVNYNVSNLPFDKELYENILDPELCQRQLKYLKENNTALLLQFRDASARYPRGILLGNLRDLGDYRQCLKINDGVDNMNIQGKYCMTRIIVEQNLKMPHILQSEFTEFGLNREMFNLTTKYENFESIFAIYNSLTRVGSDNPLLLSQLQLALCIPASCTPREAFNLDITDIGIDVVEEFCRLPNDKPWVPADYIAISIFSTIGILVMLSTVYDLWHSIILKKDSKGTDSVYVSFSAYTNTRRLLTFKSGAGSLDCIDGIRALAMLWVIVGHTVTSINYSVNMLEGLQWYMSRNAIWMSAAPVTVDTFFMLSGLLVVYTTAGKLTSVQLIKSLPLFYLHRLLRMFPLLASMILYKTSLHNRVADGPNWNTPARNVLTCRQYWWSTLLHIQNWYNPRNKCLPVTWYLSVDVQLYFLSPIILVWVLMGRRNIAWIALTAGLIASLVAATTYNFVNNFQSGLISQNPAESDKYHIYYYVNPLNRASPFVAGMIVGYILHLSFIIVSWCFSLLILVTVIYCVQLHLNSNWDNQLADNFLNSFMRPAWALGLGWVIFACAKGHGGPINWFLTLHMWKLPARLSYAIYLIHFTLMVSTYASSNVQNYFSTSNIIFDILSFLVSSTMIAFVATVTIDAPFANLFKLILPKGESTPKTKIENYAKETLKIGRVDQSETQQEGKTIEENKINYQETTITTKERIL